MSINNITNQSYNSVATTNAPDLQAKGKVKADAKENINKAAEYVPAEENKEVTYSKPDVATIDRLKEESNRHYNHLREMVRQLLERQGLTFKELGTFEGDIAIDDQARLEAQEAIGEGGPYSPENTSDRIVDFAKAISGGDKSKLKLLRGAIEKGFGEAAKAFGGQLPDISHKTYDLIMEKLDAWENDGR